MDRLQPDLRKEVERRESVKHRRRLVMGRTPDYAVGDKVYCRFWYGLQRWRKGVIVAIAGPPTPETPLNIPTPATQPDVRIDCASAVPRVAPEASSSTRELAADVPLPRAPPKTQNRLK